MCIGLTQWICMSMFRQDGSLEDARKIQKCSFFQPQNRVSNNRKPTGQSVSYFTYARVAVFSTRPFATSTDPCFCSLICGDPLGPHRDPHDLLTRLPCMLMLPLAPVLGSLWILHGAQGPPVFLAANCCCQPLLCFPTGSSH